MDIDAPARSLSQLLVRSGSPKLGQPVRMHLQEGKTLSSGDDRQRSFNSGSECVPTAATVVKADTLHRVSPLASKPLSKRKGSPNHGYHLITGRSVAISPVVDLPSPMHDSTVTDEQPSATYSRPSSTSKPTHQGADNESLAHSSTFRIDTQIKDTTPVASDVGESGDRHNSIAESSDNQKRVIMPREIVAAAGEYSRSNVESSLKSQSTDAQLAYATRKEPDEKTLPEISEAANALILSMVGLPTAITFGAHTGADALKAYTSSDSALVGIEDPLKLFEEEKAILASTKAHDPRVWGKVVAHAAVREGELLTILQRESQLAHEEATRRAMTDPQENEEVGGERDSIGLKGPVEQSSSNVDADVDDNVMLPGDEVIESSLLHPPPHEPTPPNTFTTEFRNSCDF